MNFVSKRISYFFAGRSKYNPNVNVNQVPPSFRGGRGGPMRGGFDRGRGRGRGGHPMMMGGGMRGGMMGGGPPFPPRGMMRGGPRGGMGFPRMPMRGMPMRGSRPPMHMQGIYFLFLFFNLKKL